MCVAAALQLTSVSLPQTLASQASQECDQAVFPPHGTQQQQKIQCLVEKGCRWEGGKRGEKGRKEERRKGCGKDQEDERNKGRTKMRGRKVGRERDVKLLAIATKTEIVIMLTPPLHLCLVQLPFTHTDLHTMVRIVWACHLPSLALPYTDLG